MGLESASMRRCLLWYNFIVRGMRTVGPKTQTDPWYGGFSIIFETVTCARACVCKLNILFFFLFCVSPTSPSEEVKQRGSPVADASDISQTILQRSQHHHSKNSFTSVRKRKKTTAEKAQFQQNLHHFSLLRPIFCYQHVTSAVTLFSIWAAEVSWDIYCEHVNRLCCAYRGHDLCHINPPLYARTHQVTGANASKITWLSVQHIGLIIMFLCSVS